jgi:hypothetical protein
MVEIDNGEWGMTRHSVVSIRRAGVLFYLSLTFLLADYGNALARTQSLREAIAGVVSAYTSRDSVSLNRFVHPKHGVIVIYREGVFDVFATDTKIDFDKPVPEYFAYPVIKSRAPLRYARLPVYNCEHNAWSKTGLFCDLKHRDTLLSDTAINLRQYREEKIPPETIARFRSLEAQSIRVVLVDSDGRDLVFYLTKVGNRWYLTILDRVSSDCSA